MLFLLQQASHGKITKELLNRLMSILGHLIQLRTLKVLQFVLKKTLALQYLFVNFPIVSYRSFDVQDLNSKVMFAYCSGT